jgi:arylsulfatase A-like enzyme
MPMQSLSRLLTTTTLVLTILVLIGCGSRTRTQQAQRESGTAAERSAPEGLGVPPAVPSEAEPRELPYAKPVTLDGAAPTVEGLQAAVKGANLVICVIDAARADHLGCYGYPRETTPNIDRLAKQALVFEQHFCQYPQTKPSTISLFTSQYPDTHGVFMDGTLDQSTLTMARGLKASGFDTLLFSSNRWASPFLGIGTDFDLVIPSIPGQSANWEDRGQGRPIHLQRSPSWLLAQISVALDRRARTPFFAYIHFLPPHFPYQAPPEMVKLFAGQEPPDYWRGHKEFPQVSEESTAGPHSKPGPDLVNKYDANLRYADWAVGELQLLLQQAGLFDNTLFIVTADHGETLGEHGYNWHPSCPYDEAIRVPLFVKFPGDSGPAGRVHALTQSIDLLPTLFELFDTSYPKNQVQGRSLLPLLTGQADKVNDYIFARTEGQPPCYVVRDLYSSLFLYRGGKLRALYDLEADPRQTRNVFSEEPKVAAGLISAFLAFAEAQRYPPLDFIDPSARPAPSARRGTVKMSEETRRELRALGYLK